ncbi:MAG: YlxR family protein [Candidatus Bruticola sp.]
MCVACRRVKSRDELFRLVRPTGGGEIVVNQDGRICGKGFYICRSAECLQKLEKDKRLRKNFSAKLSGEALLWLSLQLEQQKSNQTEPAAASCS